MTPPGKSFMEMLELIVANHRLPTPFSPQMLMSIFWEETLFHNRRQVVAGGKSGPGVGFGQVERQELPKLSTNRALSLGYFVPGMHGGVTQLPDHLSVQISSCMLLHLFHESSSTSTQGRVEFSLSQYSGKRKTVVDKWKLCERKLLEIPFSLFGIINSGTPVRMLEVRIMDALRNSRPFNRDAIVTVTRNGRSEQVKFSEALFPRYWFFPPADITRLSTFLPPGALLRQGSRGPRVAFLQRVLNAQRNLGRVQDLSIDSIFGPLTGSRVRLFQSASHLTADGIVGRRTHAALIG